MRALTELDHVELSDFEAGNFGPGRFAFRLVDVRPLREPVPCIGRQGFFAWHAPSNIDELLLPPVDQFAAAVAYEREAA